MSRDFAILDARPTPLGDLILRRRRLRTLGNREVYEVKLGDAFLMSSLFHEAEEALARLGLDALAPHPAAGEPVDVVVGGLGLGYTAAAALAHPRLDGGNLLVIDALEAVIDWHRQGLVPLGPTLADDGRCRLVHGDFFGMAASPETGFDPTQPRRRFHAVLLDVDHSPRNLLHPRHASFYEVGGLRKLAAHLHPGGVFALWSDDPPDADFEDNLRQVFGDTRAEVVSFPNPLLGHDSASTVYISRLPW